MVERTFKYAGAGDMIFVVGMGPGGVDLRQHGVAHGNLPL